MNLAGFVRLVLGAWMAAAFSACCRSLEARPFITRGPAITVTGRVEAVENTRDSEGICQISPEYYVLVTPSERYVLVGARDPIYADKVDFSEAWLQVKQRVGMTVTVEGQVLSPLMSDSDIACTCVRPASITD
jgi:hypothetical protein